MLRYVLIAGGVVLESIGHSPSLHRALAGLFLVIFGLLLMVLGNVWEGRVWYATLSHRESRSEAPLLPWWGSLLLAVGSLSLGFWLAASAVIWISALFLMIGLAGAIFDGYHSS